MISASVAYSVSGILGCIGLEICIEWYREKVVVTAGIFWEI